jgi:hypothetical protein
MFGHSLPINKPVERYLSKPLREEQGAPTSSQR